MEYLIMRLVHIVAGAVWVGTAIMMSWKILPASNDAGPAGGQYMGMLMNKRKLPLAMMSMALLVFITGTRLFMIRSGGAWGEYMATPVGRGLTAGALLALMGFSVGMLVNVPTSKKMGALGAQIAAAGGPPSEEQAGQMAAYRAVIAKGSLAIAILLGLAAVMMAIARVV